MKLKKNEKKNLLKLSRVVLKKELGINNEELPPKNEKFDEKRGVFVTINNKGSLRGCIGYIKAVDTIWESVKRMTKQAAFHDPRFSSIKKNEVDDLNIEISVLSKLKEVKDKKEIKIGRDGLLIRKKFYSGVLLPQVATEYNWDRIEFLQNTCKKAGLQSDCFKDETVKVYRFSAEVFDERGLNVD
ncbi:MAG TPA: AmmeMemoRadiSam system protein A [Candidatus Mcinerneyibacterium sp.]|nr:AmmeMemoRadiSam system protein A [Candidatus Mcinerneyibacterium sp.]